MDKQDFFKKNGFFLFNMVFLAMMIGFFTAIGVFFNQGASLIQASPVEAQSRNPLTVAPSVTELQTSFRSISSTVMPAIVEIRTVEESSSSPTTPENPTLPWRFFFDEAPDGNGSPNPENQERPNFKNRGLGSGIIVQRNGNIVYVLSNNHVVGEAKEITVVINDEREFPATLVGGDPRRDLALIRFETQDVNIPIATLGDSDELQVGDIVLAMGNPLGMEFSVTQGIVSALGRRGGPGENISDFIQTDASINRGNSGGALVNLKGEVIGINTWIASPTGASVGLGFSIPVNNAKRAIQDFIKTGAVQYGWLGVSIGNLPRQSAPEMNLEGKKGAFVYHVFKNSPAEKGGFFPGDFITSINGKSMKNSNEVIQSVGDLLAGSNSDFEIIRNGQNMKISVLIGLRNEERSIDAQSLNLWPGFVVIPLTDEIRNSSENYKNLKGVVIGEVVARTAGQIAGLRIGDVITKVGDQQINSISDFYKELAKIRSGELKLQFNREGVELNLGILR